MKCTLDGGGGRWVVGWSGGGGLVGGAECMSLTLLQHRKQQPPPPRPPPYTLHAYSAKCGSMFKCVGNGKQCVTFFFFTSSFLHLYFDFSHFFFILRFAHHPQWRHARLAEGRGRCGGGWHLIWSKEKTVNRKRKRKRNTNQRNQQVKESSEKGKRTSQDFDTKRGWIENNQRDINYYVFYNKHNENEILEY